MTNGARGLNRDRRSFLKTGAFGAAIGAAVFTEGMAEGASSLNSGDMAILMFLSAVEQVEADLWIQYSELGGATNQGLSPIDLTLNGKPIQTGLSAGYVAALEV